MAGDMSHATAGRMTEVAAAAWYLAVGVVGLAVLVAMGPFVVCMECDPAPVVGPWFVAWVASLLLVAAIEVPHALGRRPKRLQGMRLLLLGTACLWPPVVVAVLGWWAALVAALAWTFWPFVGLVIVPFGLLRRRP